MSSSNHPGGPSAMPPGGNPCDALRPLLDDYVDGRLSEQLSGELDAHVEDCADCRGELDALVGLLDDLAGLPRQQMPERDLWQGIAPRLQPRMASEDAAADPPVTVARSPSRWWAQAIAAGLFTLLGFSAAHILDWQRSGGADSEHRVSEGPGQIQALTSGSGEGDEAFDRSLVPADTRNADFLAAEAEFLRAKEALLMSAFQRRDVLSPATLEMLHRNLEVIDHATRELRAALEEDPANPRLEGKVLDNYRREISLLKRLTSLDA